MSNERTVVNTATSNATIHFRAIWISDVHLGTPGCHATLLLDFLRRTESDYLYLVGDIVDALQLRRFWYWPQAHNDVLQKLIRKARKGTRVVYIPGNHDSPARQFAALAFGGIRIENESIHVTEDGKRLLVMHGDRFDAVVRHGTWIAQLGAGAFVHRLGEWSNAIRARLGLKFWSLARFLRRREKIADRLLDRFEQAAIAEARRLGVDGVVCGHIHKPDVRVIDGILYCNDGDWVDSATALVEMEDGELQLVDWRGIALPRVWRARRSSAAAATPGRPLTPSPVTPDYAHAPGD